ncbi:thioredoxin family protein [Bacillus sp. AK031]
MQNEMTLEKIETTLKDKKYAALYLYTPLCGTCMVAGRMVDVIEKLFSQIDFMKADLNYIPAIADSHSVESVPCLLLFRDGQLQEKIYAFQSVPYLHERLNILIKD